MDLNHSRIARAAESAVFRLAARIGTMVATAALALVGWLWTELWDDLTDTVKATAADVSDLSDYTVQLSGQYEILGITVRDHERRIRRVEMTGAPWRGREQ